MRWLLFLHLCERLRLNRWALGMLQLAQISPLGARILPAQVFGRLYLAGARQHICVDIRPSDPE